MSSFNPIPRGNRRKDVVAYAGQSVFAPTDFKVYDAADVRVRVKPSGALAFVTALAGFTITLTGAAPAYPVVTFASGRVAGDMVRIEGAMTPSRTTDVTYGGVVRSTPLETELDRIAAFGQESRRDFGDMADSLDALDATSAAVATNLQTAVTAATEAAASRSASATSQAAAAASATASASSAAAALAAIDKIAIGIVGGVASYDATQAALATKLPISGAPSVAVGDNVGQAKRVRIVDTSTTDGIGTPTGFFFRQESYAADSQTFHLPWVFQLNSNGTGPRQTLSVNTNLDGHAGGDFLVGAQFRNTTATGGGFSIGVAAQACGLAASDPSTQLEAAEFAVEGTGPALRNVGVHVINSWNGPNIPTVSAGVLVNAAGVPAGQGWTTGLLFGYDQLPVRTYGALIDTMTSATTLRAIADFSKVQPGTDGGILLPYASNIKFGGSSGAGGRVVSAASAGGRVLFGDGITVLDFNEGQQHKFTSTGYRTTGSLFSSQALTGVASGAPDALAGTPGSTLDANTIFVTEDVSTGGGAIGGISQALRLVHRYGGPNSQANHQSLYVNSLFTNTDSPDAGWTNRNHVAGVFTAKAQAPSGGSSAGVYKGALFGQNLVAELSAGASNWLDLTGVEADVGIAASQGASSAYRVGFRASSYGDGQASVLDTAFQVGVLSAGSSPWKYGIMFTSADNPAKSPVSGVLIGGANIGAAGTKMTGLSGGIDFNSFTFDNYAFASAGFLIGPTGNLTAATAAFNAGTDATAFLQPGTSSNSIALVAANNANTTLRSLTIGCDVLTLAASRIQMPNLKNAANDSAAAAAGVQVGDEYRNGSVRMVRVA